MKYSLIILSLICIFSCNQKPKTNIRKFNSFIGKEKAYALNQLVNSYDDFLQRNFPDSLNNGEKTLSFLNILSRNFSPDSTWIFNTEKNKLILKDFENTGLRKELYLYNCENHEPEYFLLYMADSTNHHDQPKLTLVYNDTTITDEIDSADLMEIPPIEYDEEDSINFNYYGPNYDSALYFNIHGKYLTGLAYLNSADYRIQEYIEARHVGDISPYIILGAFINIFKPNDLEDPIIKRIIIIESYYEIVQMDLENKNSAPNNI